jgi:hypothetical protein
MMAGEGGSKQVGVDIPVLKRDIWNIRHQSKSSPSPLSPIRTLSKKEQCRDAKQKDQCQPVQEQPVGHLSGFAQRRDCQECEESDKRYAPALRQSIPWIALECAPEESYVTQKDEDRAHKTNTVLRCVNHNLSILTPFVILRSSEG